MNKNCCICGRKAAWGVIDKMGFMKPGTLCPSHYLTWKDNAGAWCFIFRILPGGTVAMKQFFGERQRKKKIDEGFEPHEKNERNPKTMAEAKIEVIVQALEGNQNNVQATCRELNISKAMLYRQLSHYHISFARTVKKKLRQKEG